MTSTSVATRTVQRVVKGMPTSDGAGVKLRRVIGQPQLAATSIPSSAR